MPWVPWVPWVPWTRCLGLGALGLVPWGWNLGLCALGLVPRARLSVRRQLWGIGRRLLIVVGCQLAFVSRRSAVVGHQVLVVSLGHWLSVVVCQSSVVGPMSSVVRHPSPVACRPSSVAAWCPLAVVSCPSQFVHHRLCVVCRALCPARRAPPVTSSTPPVFIVCHLGRSSSCCLSPASFVALMSVTRHATCVVR